MVRRNGVYLIYWEWLAKQVGPGSDWRRYRELLSAMHEKEFVWFVPNDDNRMFDGMDLRPEFISEYPKWTIEDLQLPFVSFLEVLVALSRRLEFQTNWSAYEWAFKLIEHLGLNKMTDPLTQSQKEEIDGIQDRVIWRQYSASGEGGLFPLSHPTADQTKVEIWYQMHAWIGEHS